MHPICTKICAKDLKRALSIRKHGLPLVQTGSKLEDQPGTPYYLLFALRDYMIGFCYCFPWVELLKWLNYFNIASISQFLC